MKFLKVTLLMDPCPTRVVYAVKLIADIFLSEIQRYSICFPKLQRTLVTRFWFYFVFMYVMKNHCSVKASAFYFDRREKKQQLY